jgi:hypothetical protein
VGVFINRNTRTPILQTLSKNGGRGTLSLDGMASLEANAANVSSLAISPDGKLLAVGFEAGRAWVVTREGVIRNRIGPLKGVPKIDAVFTSDSKRLVMRGWFATGLMGFDGNWIWEAGARNLDASRTLSLSATLTAPMHGPQGGDIMLLDSQGRILWKEMAWNAAMAAAPDGSFAVFQTTPEKPQQATTPPFPIAPELGEISFLSIRDKNGKPLAEFHRPFNGTILGVSGDSRCILLSDDRDLLAVDRQLKDAWRLRNALYTQYGGSLILQSEGDVLRMYRMPACK